MEGTLRGYARHRHESLKAVQKAITSGRISRPKNGKLDFGLADEEWTRNTAPRATAKASTSDAGGYATARAVKEQYNARLAKLDWQERTGKLLDRDHVEAAAFNTYHTLRDQLLSIPDRMAAILAAESDPAVVHKLLDAELRARLTEFANGIVEPAGGGDEVPDSGGGGSAT